MEFWISIYGCQSYPRNGHWCSKSAQKLQLLLATVGEVGCFSNQTILVEITEEFRGLLPKGKVYICHQNSSRIPLRKRSQLKPCHTRSYSHKSSKNTIDCGKYFNFATSRVIRHYNCHATTSKRCCHCGACRFCSQTPFVSSDPKSTVKARIVSINL